MRRLVALLALALVPVADAAAATARYATPGGLTTGECGESAPCTLVRAAAAAADGDGILVARGVHDIGTETLTLPANVTMLGDLTDPPVIRSAKGGFGAVVMPGANGRLMSLRFEQQTPAGQSAFVISPGFAATDVRIGSVEVVITGPAATATVGIAAINGWRIVGSAVRGRDHPVSGIEMNDTGAATLDHVTVDAQPGTGLVAFDGSVIVTNSILRGATGDIRAQNGVVNVSSSNYATTAVTATGAIVPGAGNQTQAPVFASGVEQAATSPTVNAAPLVDTTDQYDLRLSPRHLGTAPDIGADEFEERPAATTGDASDVGVTTATVAATVNPNRVQTDVHVEYGPTPAYGERTTPRDVGWGIAPEAMTTTLAGLPAGAVVHYRVVATNFYGTTYGADRTLTTRAAPAGTPAAVAPPRATGFLPIPAVRDRTTPRGAVRVARGQRRADVLRRGLRVELGADEAASARVTVLAGTRGIGSATASVRAGRPAVVRARIARRHARTVRRARRLAVRVVFTDAAGNARTVRFTARLR